MDLTFHHAAHMLQNTSSAECEVRIIGRGDSELPSREEVEQCRDRALDLNKA